jgi:hypothetical protein
MEMKVARPLWGRLQHEQAAAAGHPGQKPTSPLEWNQQFAAWVSGESADRLQPVSGEDCGAEACPTIRIATFT